MAVTKLNALKARLEDAVEGEYPVSDEVSFDNGWGASIVRNALSAGGTAGLFEVAVWDYDGNMDFAKGMELGGLFDDIDGVAGHLDVSGALEAVSQIRAI